MNYEINGIQYSQGRLPVASLLRLVRLFKGRAAGGGNLGVDYDGLMALAEDPAAWGEFLGIIFGKPGPVVCDLETLDAEVALGVVADFLSCNAGVVKQLTRLLNGTASAVTNGRPAH